MTSSSTRELGMRCLLSAGTCSIRYPRCRSSQPRAVGLRVWDAAFETLATLGLLPTRKHMKTCAFHSPDRRQGMTTARMEAVLSPASQVTGTISPTANCLVAEAPFRHYHGTWSRFGGAFSCAST